MTSELAGWEKITPQKLAPAVKHIRETFMKSARQCSRVTWDACYLALHPQEADASSLSAFRADFPKYLKIVGPEAEQQFHDSLMIGTPPSLLKAYVDVYRCGMKINVREQFDETLLIGLANQELLNVRSAEIALITLLGLRTTSVALSS